MFFEMNEQHFVFHFALTTLDFNLTVHISATASLLQVKLSLTNELPIVVEYPIDEDGTSYLRFFLAPKIQEDEDAMNE